jgi:hypothetical protein
MQAPEKRKLSQLLSNSSSSAQIDDDTDDDEHDQHLSSIAATGTKRHRTVDIDLSEDEVIDEAL